MSNGLDPDQDRHFVGPDLGPNCFAKFIGRRREAFFMSTRAVVFMVVYFENLEIRSPCRA